MKVKRFSTIINLNEIQDEAVAIYITGRIDGMMCAICDYPHAAYYHAIYQRRTPDGKITGYWIVTKCTTKEYMIFKNIVEKYYPGVCTFNPAIEK